MSGYPYGAAPGGYPYVPYGGRQPAAAPSRKEKQSLFITANLIGAAMLAYLLLSELVSFVLAGPAFPPDWF